MKNLHWCLIILICLILSGCDDSFPLEGEMIPQEDVFSGLSRTKIHLDSQDAAIVAGQLRKGTKSVGTTISSIIPILDESGTPALYAVNFGGDNGYTIVSATKAFYPVLAIVDKGHFDSALHGTEELLIDEFVHDIVISSKSEDENIRKYAAAWREFESSFDSSVSSINQTKSGDKFSFISSSISTWISQGYYVYSIEERPSGLPESVYNNYLAIAEGLTNPNEDFRYQSFILVERTRSVYQHGPLLSSEWGQLKPYNNSTPIGGITPWGEVTHTPVGCVAVAMGQIMKYHAWPTSINWSLIPDVDTDITNTSETQLSNLLLGIGRNVSMDYTQDGSYSSISRAYSAFRNSYDYRCDQVDDFNEYDVESSICRDRPVYLKGQNPLNGEQHAWVADGVISNQFAEIFSLRVLSISEPYEFLSPGERYYDTSGSQSIHMNMGDNENQGSVVSGNGWYYINNNSTNYVYSTNKKMICNIRPNR